MKLILLRGPSGSGKSTIARHLGQRDGVRSSVHETDQYFMTQDGYSFDPKKLPRAHAWNQEQVRTQMENGVPLVIVSNTFIKHWEMEPYFKLAGELGYKTEMICTPRPWNANVLLGRNKHNVPLSVIERHISDYQPHLDEHEWTNTSIFPNE